MCCRQVDNSEADRVRHAPGAVLRRRLAVGAAPRRRHERRARALAARAHRRPAARPALH